MILNYIRSLSSRSESYAVPFAAAPTYNVESTKTVAQKSGRYLARAHMETYSTGITILTYLERDDHGVGPITIHMRVSNDYGTTWSDEDKYLDGTNIVGFPYADTVDYHVLRVIECPDGSLLMPRWSATVSHRSTDNGRTWTQFTAVFPEPDQYGKNGVPGEFAIILDGIIYMPLKYYSSGQYNTNYIAYANALTWAYSEDNGASWVKGQRIAWYADPPTNNNTVGANPPPQGADEPMLTYHGNGLFRMAGRITTVDGFYGWHLPDFGTGTVTITDLAYQIPWAAGRLSGHQRAKLKKQPQWWKDPVLFAFGFEFTTPNFGEDRQHCFIASKDGGETWIGPYAIDIVAHDGGYGDVIYNPILDQYVFVSYHEVVSGDKAIIKQYNVSVEWD